MAKKRKHSETEVAPPPKKDDTAPERPKRTLLGFKDKTQQKEEIVSTVFRNKEKVLVTCSRRISYRYRHLMLNLVSLLPHCKKDSKVESKQSKGPALNELVELKSCSSCLFFECRKKKDLYLWMAKSPNGPSAGETTRGLIACGTGVGVAMFANKFPGVFAATCLTPADALNARSISNCNVLAVSGISTSPSAAVEILETWLKTPFKSPCPASGGKPWPPEIESFLDNSLSEIPKIGAQEKEITTDTCSICCLVKNRDLNPIEMIPGGSMKIVRESPTSAIVRFTAGSVEPAHHHTFGHDLVVMEGKKSVWNLSKKERFDLGVGDYLYTPAGDVHRVKYHEDTEFFIKWDGHWDMFFDEDLEAAKTAIEDSSE